MKTYYMGWMLIVALFTMAAPARAQVYGKLKVAATLTVQLEDTYNDNTGVTKQTTKTVKVTNADILAAMGAPSGDSLGLAYDGGSLSVVILDQTGKAVDDSVDGSQFGFNLDTGGGVTTGTYNDSGAFKLSGQGPVEISYDDGTVAIYVTGITTFARSQTADADGNITGLSFSIKSAVSGTASVGGYSAVVAESLSASGSGKVSN